MISLSKTEDELTKVSLDKVTSEEDKEILGNHVVNLSKCVIDLSKINDIDLGSHRARVVVVFDHSLSMKHLYDSGAIQNIINRLVPLGLQFDDNGEIDVYTFDSVFRHFEGLTLKNYRNYIKDVIIDSGIRYGGTEYADVLKDIMHSYFKKSLFGKTKDNSAVYILFITDGDNSDKHKTNEVIKESSKKNMFIEFVGIGDSSFKYLEKLDDLSDRECDNTGFVRIDDMENEPDSSLYNKILDQYPAWLKARNIQ